MNHGRTEWGSGLSIPDLRGVVRYCHDVGAFRAERHAVDLTLVFQWLTDYSAGGAIPDPYDIIV